MKKIVCIVFLFTGAAFAQTKKPLPEYLQVKPAVFSLSLVMMHDVINPPAASRFYCYPMLAAYDIICQQNTAFKPLSTFLKNYTPASIQVHKSKYDYRIAAMYAILETAKRMLPSGYMLQADEEKYIGSLNGKFPSAIIRASIDVANTAAENMVAYAKTDGYGKLSARLRYTPIKGDGMWYPTPPSYLEAVEPNWKTIRTMIIDSCNQFPPLAPQSFSKDSTSSFYGMAKEVYHVSKNLSPVQLHIASFWDCNPFNVNTSGHMAIGFKKISPGGHWMNITGIAASKARLSFDSVVLLYTMVSVTLVDAFISCWDEKYRSNRIRPETYINRYIDLKWQPLLQTPPFPEYTSGHSVISAAAAEVLSYFLGDKFTYTDDSEAFFDIQPRSFKSFRQAASEAAISRLYGGIHFRDAVENGQQEGMAIGKWVVQKLKTMDQTNNTKTVH